MDSKVSSHWSEYVALDIDQKNICFFSDLKKSYWPNLTTIEISTDIINKGKTKVNEFPTCSFICSLNTIILEDIKGNNDKLCDIRVFGKISTKKSKSNMYFWNDEGAMSFARIRQEIAV